MEHPRCPISQQDLKESPVTTSTVLWYDILFNCIWVHTRWQ